jgi:hypothetical protein
MIPMLYVTFQSMRERLKKRFGGSGENSHPSSHPPTTTT